MLAIHRHDKNSCLPQTPPTLNEMIKMIASLGGYIDRPSQNSHPGTKTLWIGLQQTHSLSAGWLAFGPESKKFRQARCV
ncbi:IS4 family transposase [Novipirellula artificiosorum]|uniref:Transposase Tn5 dimerisation domain-containing protein n=1 Tax=Novipirellula artificiosorum TaxID=2528016 RepID=A0A5C6DT70_9BACT|nr:hypothetical protein Poly41_13460 [Novipirellula artificiosorum]